MEPPNMMTEIAPPTESHGTMMAQIANLAPAEILSSDGAAGLFAHFEADTDLAWDRTQIMTELAEHPRRALKWAMLAAAGERYVADLQLSVKDLRARLDANVRKRFTDAAVKSTEAMVTAAIDSDPEWKRMLHGLHDAQAKAEVCRAVWDLFRQRKDLLIQDALQVRAEGAGNDPVLAYEARVRQRKSGGSGAAARPDSDRS